MNGFLRKLAIPLLIVALSVPCAANACWWYLWDQNKIYSGPHAAQLKHLQESLRSQRRDVRTAMRRMSRAERRRLDNSWVGNETNPRIIATPFKRLTQISEKIGFQADEKFVDFGSGTGEPGLVLATLHPELKVAGYEVNRAKVDGANTVAQKEGLKNAQFQTQDLADQAFEIPDADYYYFFNPAYRPVIQSLAVKIRNRSFDSTSTRRHLVLLYGGDYSDGVWAPSIFRQYGFKAAQGFDAEELKKIKLQVLEYRSLD